LPRRQSEIRASGHAMEARIYAEDPDQGFVPSTGRIEALTFPSSPELRIDSGVDQGDEVSIHYDPMIAKMIVHDEDREQARQALIRALSGSSILGPTTNLGFLQHLAASRPFADGSLDTGMLDRDPGAVIAPISIAAEDYAVAAAAWLKGCESHDGKSPWCRTDGWRIGDAAAQSIELEIAGQRAVSEVTGFDGDYRIEIGDQVFELGLEDLGQGLLLLQTADFSERIRVHRNGAHGLDLIRGGRRLRAQLHRPFEAIVQSGQAEGRLLAPMPGKVLSIEVVDGATVSEGQTLVIMEAMKMELAIKAPCDGSVEGVAVQVGDIIEAEALLLEIQPGS